MPVASIPMAGRPQRLAGAVPRDGRILDLGTAVELPVVVWASRCPENSQRACASSFPISAPPATSSLVNPELYYVYSVFQLDL